MTVQTDHVPEGSDGEGEAHPALSLVKEPPAPLDEQPMPVGADEDQDQDADEDEAQTGGTLAEINALVGRDAWTEAAHETGALVRDIAAHYAGVPRRAVRAVWRATVIVVVRIKDGSVILGGRVVEWVSAEESKPKSKKTKKKGKPQADAASDEDTEWPAFVKRGGLVLLVAAGLYHEGKDHPVTVAAVTVTAWSAAALIASRNRTEDIQPTTSEEARPEEPEQRTATQNNHEKAGEGQVELPTREQAAALLARYVEYAVAAADHLKKHKGVHTETLLEGIENHRLRPTHLDPLEPQGGEWDVPRLNAAFTALGIPVHTKGFKIIIDGQQRVRAGVRYDQLENHLGRRPRLPPSLVEDITPVQTAD
ncbi:hypothetical protein [Streptomyces sp. NPDC055036]